jgi:hypothetical protein
MPRVLVHLTLVDDDQTPFLGESWSTLGYDDLGNPNLPTNRRQNLTLEVLQAERALLDRLRTSISRYLLSFARRERRRWARTATVEDQQDINEALIEQDPIPYPAMFGDFIPNIEPEVNEVHELTGVQLSDLIAAQPLIEDLQKNFERTDKRAKRVSRYKRKPVI